MAASLYTGKSIVGRMCVCVGGGGGGGEGVSRGCYNYSGGCVSELLTLYFMLLVGKGKINRLPLCSLNEEPYSHVQLSVYRC